MKCVLINGFGQHGSLKLVLLRRRRFLLAVCWLMVHAQNHRVPYVRATYLKYVEAKKYSRCM